MKKVVLLVLALVMSMACLVPSFAAEETVSELFWIAKLTVGAGGEVKDAEKIDFGTTDDPALQEDLTPGEYVTHASYDEVRPGVLCGQEQNGDVNITLPTVAGPENGKNTVMFWGWIGAAGEIVNFSYSIDGGEKVDVDKYDTEQGVVDAAMGVEGTTDASRYQVNVPIAGDGTYVIRIYANIKVDTGDEPSAGGDQKPDDQKPDDQKPDNTPTADTSALVCMVAAAVVIATVLLKKRAF